MQRFALMLRYLQPIKQGVLRGYNVAFSPKYLLYTNSTILVSIVGLGDAIRQRIEICFDAEQKYNFTSTRNMMTFGMFSAPIQHYWYLALDRFIVKGKFHQIVTRKVIADQLIFSPFFVVGFLMGLGLLEGSSFEECKKEVKEKALELYIVDCTVWPAAQAINFYFLPSHLRLAYITFVTLCYNVFLSYYKHKDDRKT